MEQSQQLPPAGAAPEPPAAPPPAPKPPINRSKIINGLLATAALALAAGGLYWAFGMNHSPKQQTNSASSPPAPTAIQNTAPQVQGIQLDPSKNYGNKYANGILPVGDGKYSASAPKTGYIYACSGYVYNMQNQAGGAGRRGPWFIGTTQYDLNKKIHVSGAVKWPDADHLMTLKNSTRTITTNNLPLGYTTGVFPISSNDPAYAYDKNPNAIKAQSFTYSLNASPTYSNSPSCEGGQVGVMLTGVALFNGLDAGGRDAGAWEVQDSCDGHPQKDGIYHYHTLSSCIKDIRVRDIIGFALDGFPITGPQVGANNYLTTSDLDECHGLTSQIVLDGKTVTTYHYVMTQDYPYSVSCFRGKPIQPPGQANGVPTNHP